MAMLWLICMNYLMWDSVLSSSLCSNLQGVMCCAGSFWNKEKSTCEKCPIGYYGSNCSEACKSPHFGEECQDKCNCSPHFCDHITGCFEHFSLSSKNVPISYDITPYQMKLSSSRSGDSSSVTPFPDVVVYTAVTFVIVFVVFFGLFSGTYFYKHCLKQTSVSDEKQIDNQQERYNILLQSSHTERENNRDPAYLEPISNGYEEIENYAETVN